MEDRPTTPRTDPQWPKLLSLSAHELRTPLSVVAGYIRMLVKEQAGPISEQQRSVLEKVEESCAQLSRVLEEISELSQLESGDAEIQPRYGQAEVDTGRCHCHPAGPAGAHGENCLDRRQ